MSQNESTIEQINLGFNDQEDRLLLKIGLADKTEVAVWITRNICKQMWHLLHNGIGELSSIASETAIAPITTPENNQQIIEQFAKEITQQKEMERLDFHSEYIATRHTRTEVPMLAVKCAIVLQESSAPELTLECTNGQSVKILLNKELVYALTNMMQLATREADWNLIMTLNSNQVRLNKSQQVLH